MRKDASSRMAWCVRPGASRRPTGPSAKAAGRRSPAIRPMAARGCSVATLIDEMISSSNLSFGLYPGLSYGAYVALHSYGSDALKDIYLPKLVEGVWSGTMCLTEPHCGTDLGLLRTRAVPQDDGSYRITGTKIFISAGDHDLTENIVHLVLARRPDAPPGIGGISLFLVPKFLVRDDSSLAA